MKLDTGVKKIGVYIGPSYWN